MSALPPTAIELIRHDEPPLRANSRFDGRRCVEPRLSVARRQHCANVIACRLVNSIQTAQRDGATRVAWGAGLCVARLRARENYLRSTGLTGIAPAAVELGKEALPTLSR